MPDAVPDCTIHRVAVEMVRSSTHLDERLDRAPTVAECHSCRVCQLARELAFLRSEEAGGRVSRRRHEPPEVWHELKAEVVRRHGK